MAAVLCNISPVPEEFEDDAFHFFVDAFYIATALHFIRSFSKQYDLIRNLLLSTQDTITLPFFLRERTGLSFRVTGITTHRRSWWMRLPRDSTSRPAKRSKLGEIKSLDRDTGR